MASLKPQADKHPVGCRPPQSTQRGVPFRRPADTSRLSSPCSQAEAGREMEDQVLWRCCHIQAAADDPVQEQAQSS